MAIKHKYAVDTDIVNTARGDTIHFTWATSPDAAINRIKFRLLGRRGFYHSTIYWTATVVA